jgi:hypothetical protein
VEDGRHRFEILTEFHSDSSEHSIWSCLMADEKTRGHLFGGCKAWKRECLALKKRIERITGKRRKRGQRRRERGARVKVVDLFKDERLTGAVLDFLKDTDVGKRYE